MGSPSHPVLGPARMPGLDALRACAILWVMVYHAIGFGLVPEGWRLLDSGWMGVDLFFVLSGYLIGGQLFRPVARGEPIDLRGFYARRALRTLPAFFVVLAIYFALPQLREWKPIQPLWQFLTFTENLFVVTRPAKAFSHVWSLCVEEQFYLVFPLAVLVLTARPALWKGVAAGLALLALGMVLRGAVWLHDLGPYVVHGVARHGYVQAYMERIYLPTWMRMDGLLAGLAIAAVEVFRPAAWRAASARPRLLLAAGAAGLVAALALFKTQCPPLVPAVVGYPLLSASLGLVLIAAASPQCPLLGRPIPGLRAVAAASYSLYLSHKLAMHWAVVRFGVDGEPVRLLPGLAAALAVAAAGAALYLLVEKPFLKLRGRLVARRPGLAMAAE
ncbi:MAG TPA: acyltransferase [Phenylobacterium sp.]|nr:acyltransferase [Phenylobacterium sp.]